VTRRALLDTNILIHREAKTVVRDDIGTLFRWLDQLRYEKCVHPDSVGEVQKHEDPKVVRTFERKLQSYSMLRTLAADTPGIAALRCEDQSENDRIDTSVLAEVAGDRVDILITEDRNLHKKAAKLGLTSRVFTIDAFLEKVTAENPALADYKVLSVKKVLFGDVNLKDPFFDSFRADYPEFDQWFNRKADHTAYVCTSDVGEVVAFLYIKKEGPDENYGDIEPRFKKANRLKIGTFKVVFNGHKLGERFLKIVFDNALRNKVDEIYVTAFRNTAEHDRLVRLLEDWGFVEFGFKGDRGEKVWVRNFSPLVDSHDPRRTFPYVSRKARKFIVSIYPEYHTELLPDSILKTEKAKAYRDDKPYRNALSKVFISRSFERGLKTGDIVVFYRTADRGSGHHTSVATSIGVVQEVIDGIPDLPSFTAACRKRSVFTDAQLKEFWDYKPQYRPFVLNFLFVYSLPKRPNLKALQENDIIQAAPRGFDRMTDQAFERLLKVSDAQTGFIVG
jgi:hypothetical protein